MKAIDRYISLADEVISLYKTYRVRNYRIQGLEYIKRLQRDVQTFNPQDIESELTADYPDVTTLQRRLDFVVMKLDGYLIDYPISDDDLLGDGGDRHRYLIAKLGQKIGMEYVIRLHSVLEWLNYDSRVIVEMIKQLKAMDANPHRGERRGTSDNEHNYPISEKYKPIIKEIYDHLNGIAFQATESAFGTAIEKTDLSGMYRQPTAIKNKIAYMIYILSKVMGKEWYGCASGSIGISKQQCSGANVEEDMKQLKDEIEKMKSKIDKAG